VLEYLRIYKIAKLKTLRHIFGPGVHQTVNWLLRYGYLKKFTLKRIKIGNEYLLKKVYLKPSQRKYPTYLELTPLAYKYLMRYGATTFYDTPRARLTEREIIKRPFVKFGDWL